MAPTIILWQLKVTILSFRYFGTLFVRFAVQYRKQILRGKTVHFEIRISAVSDHKTFNCEDASL